METRIVLMIVYSTLILPILIFLIIYYGEKWRGLWIETRNQDAEAFDVQPTFDTVYRESQNPLWIHILIIVIILSIQVLVPPAAGFDLYSILLIPGLFVVLSFLLGGLYMKVREQSVDVRMGVLRFRLLRISLDSILSVEVAAFRPMRDFGGWGIKRGWSKTFRGVQGYFLSGTRGVLIQNKNGKKYLLGSDTPERLAAVIRSRIEKCPNHKVEELVVNESEYEKALNAKKEAKQEKILMWSMGFVILSIFVVMFAVVGLLFWGEKEPTVKITDNGVQISSMYGVKIDFTEIADISLINNTISSIGLTMRTNGLGTGSTQKGYFQSNKHGSVLLFTKTNSSPTIHIKREGKEDVFLNFRNNETTKTLYNDLKTAFER
ncbi:MAG: hypothetical protein FWE67_14730 [Planctomycetaceae bacterium]|nr:hypothetical protein [Planctomycetaceae bacterium]